MTDKLLWKGHVKVVARYADGTEHVDEFDNLVVNTGLDLMAYALDGKTISIDRVAVGYGTTATTATMTTLESEFNISNDFPRKPVSKRIVDTDSHVLKTYAYIAPFEGNDHMICEIGWFTAPDAEHPDGIMFARAIYPDGGHQKSILESLTIYREDTFTSSESA
jgi:hypothetical protein